MLGLPYFTEIYYLALYYLMTMLLVLASISRVVWEQEFEQRFYNNWQKARKQGFWLNLAREGLRTFAFMTVMVALGQLFGHGRTPLEIVAKLQGSALTWVLLLLLAFSLLAGVAAWYENDKRYYRIHYSMTKNDP